MACRFLDGFDHYTTAQITTKWTSLTNVPGITSGGRFGGGGMYQATNWNAGVNLTLDSQATWIVGFALRVSALPATVQVLRFIDAGTLHVDLRLQNSGIFQVTRNGTVLGTGAAVVSTNTWYYIEIKVTINDTTGVVVVKVNNVTDINLSGVDTRNAANASSNQFSFGGISGATATVNFDDIYIFDATGSVNNDFAGPQRVWTAYPSEAGNYAQFTGTPGNNVGNVRDIGGADDDGSFNHSSTNDQIDSFVFDDAPVAAGTITAIQHVITAKTDGGAARKIGAFQRSGTTDYVETGQSLTSSYSMVRFPRDTDPDTAAQFTAANLAAAEFGYKNLDPS